MDNCRYSHPQSRSSNGGRYLRFVAELFVGVVVAGVVAELVAGVVPLVDVPGSGETGSM